jgi:hypothetical protein
VTLSCNPDGTVHWVAVVHNSGTCTTTQPWKLTLQQHVPGSGGFTGVVLQTGISTFAPGDTTVSGDICYNFPANVNAIRAEFKVDGVNPLCIAKLKSAGIAPCQHTGGCLLDFTDVQPNDAYYTGVMSLHSAGVVSGYADGTFRPYDSVTRAQIAKIVVLAFNIPLVSVEGQRFSDVGSGDIFAQYIETAYSANLISGYADGTYRPNANVTRGQLAKIVVAAAGYKLASPEHPTFSDVAERSTFYSYIETAYAHGILAGYPDGTFKAEAQANRGQVCKIVKLASDPPQE